MKNTDEQYIYPRIDDAEIKTDYTLVQSKCVGTSKTNTDIMLTISHNHGTDIKPNPEATQGIRNGHLIYYPGKAYLFLTKEQAKVLLDQLSVELVKISKETKP